MDPKFPEYQKQFINNLETFVGQCYKFVEIHEKNKFPQSEYKNNFIYIRNN